MSDHEFDVFISHASEDKSTFAEPLAIELRRWGLEVWFDRFTLKVGDSLRDSIETGLSRSRYGVVIFSESFISKFWPKAELNGLFARETGGEKVILPVWHEISAARMREVLPIQADKVALRSSDGVKAVAKAIVEMVRPELLTLEVKKRLAFDAGSSLLEVAREEHPGWSFSFQSGSPDGPVKPGTLATVTQGSNRIDMSISDPSLLPVPPVFSVAFSREGLNKLDEFQRTGKAQAWAPGELLFCGGNIPLMPKSEDAPTLAMTVTPNVSHLPITHVRLEIGACLFPLMEMKFVRDGLAEKEAVIRNDNSALELHFVFSTDGTQRVEPSFEWNFVGRRFSECEKVIEAIDELSRGAVVRIVTLDRDLQPMEMPSLSDQLKDDPFPEELRAFVFLGAQIQSTFKVDLRFRPELNISEEDSASLTHLDCLLNGTAFGNNIRIKGFAIVKQGGEIGVSQRLTISGQPGTFFMAPTIFPSYFNLWGAKVYTPAWGLFTESCVVESDLDVAGFDEAGEGTIIPVTLVGKTPTYVRWADSNQPATPLGYSLGATNAIEKDK